MRGFSLDIRRIVCHPRGMDNKTLKDYLLLIKRLRALSGTNDISPSVDALIEEVSEAFLEATEYLMLIKDSRAEIDNLSKTLRTAQSHIDKLTAENEGMLESLRKAQAYIDSLKTENEQLRDELQRANEEITHLAGW